MKFKLNDQKPCKSAIKSEYRIRQQFDANSIPSQNEEKRVLFIEIPFSSTNGPDPPFMENEIFDLMK